MIKNNCNTKLDSLIRKLRKIRNKELKLKKYIQKIEKENSIFRCEINNLEKNEEKIRELLSDNTKKMNYIEDNIETFNKIQYRINHKDNNDLVSFVSDLYNSESEAINYINKYLQYINTYHPELISETIYNFTIEKIYTKINS